MNKNDRYCGKLHELSMIAVIVRGRWLLGEKRVLGSLVLQ